MNKHPKIAILGYGSMGREIEAIAHKRNIKVTNIFDIDSPMKLGVVYDFDVAIDFTYPDAVIDNLRMIAGMNKSVVIGTTGWHGDMDEARSIVEGADIGCVWGTNFSLGMQMFFRVVEQAARHLNKLEQYDIMLHEMHHANKKDVPSGTALTLSEIILKEVDFKNKTDIQHRDGTIDPEALQISSSRGGDITGRHTVYIDSYADSIELTHRAKNRSGFASGALTAAQWLHGKKGFYNFNEVLKGMWGE